MTLSISRIQLVCRSGGSDQWEILTGTELVRRMNVGEEAFKALI
jgi:tyrosyl-tRNA synthetase